MRRGVRTITGYIALAAAGILGILICLPVLMVLSGSLADGIEWTGRMRPLLDDGGGYIQWKWIPDFPTLLHYQELLFYTPSFLKLFWNSIKIAVFVLGGQLLVGIPGAWAFAAYDFKGKNLLFTLYVVLMFLPFQVMLLARYLALSNTGLINTHGAVILPAIFSTFPVFLMYRGFCRIPGEFLEMARLEGAGEWNIFRHIGLPLGDDSIRAAFILSFFEVWNMMEEPLAFLKDMSLWPLSLYLPEIRIDQAGRSFAASVVTLTVSLFFFGMFRESMEQGIVAQTMKG